MKNHIKIISFDGLNRSGKGTQISLTKSCLESKLESVKVIRGDGSREGVNSNDYYDPPSAWWRRWQENKLKSSSDWNKAYLILNKELEDEVDIFRNNESSGFFLMDRCYVSRWFMERQKDRAVPFEEVIKQTQVFPETYFVLDVPKEILLSRLNGDTCNKSLFRKEIIVNWYSLWEDTVNRAQEKLRNKMIRINGIKSELSINKQIIQEIYKNENNNKNN